MVKQNKRLKVGVKSAKQVSSDFTKAWKRAEKGIAPTKPINRLHFADALTLFKYLSPKRLELLQYLREAGPLSIRKLATALHRDYKNVHTDTKDLIDIGLILQTKENLLSVPWDVIVSELPLLAKAK